MIRSLARCAQSGIASSALPLPALFAKRSVWQAGEPWNPDEWKNYPNVNESYSARYNKGVSLRLPISAEVEESSEVRAANDEQINAYFDVLFDDQYWNDMDLKAGKYSEFDCEYEKPKKFRFRIQLKRTRVLKMRRLRGILRSAALKMPELREEAKQRRDIRLGEIKALHKVERQARGGILESDVFDNEHLVGGSVYGTEAAGKLQLDEAALAAEASAEVEAEKAALLEDKAAYEADEQARAAKRAARAAKRAAQEAEAARLVGEDAPADKSFGVVRVKAANEAPLTAAERAVLAQYSLGRPRASPAQLLVNKLRASSPVDAEIEALFRG